MPAPTAPLDDADITRRLGELPGWTQVAGGIAKTFHFDNHAMAVAFVNAVAWISHRTDHHPDTLLGYRTCTLTYRSHDIDALSIRDFDCAARVEALFFAP